SRPEATRPQGASSPDLSQQPAERTTLLWLLRTSDVVFAQRRTSLSGVPETRQGRRRMRNDHDRLNSKGEGRDSELRGRTPIGLAWWDHRRLSGNAGQPRGDGNARA